MRFKLEIKHCTKLDFDLVQNSTGPCSLTSHPCFSSIVPWSSCLLANAGSAVTSCCLPGRLPPGWPSKPRKSNSFLGLSCCSCHLWAWSKTRVVWMGLRAQEVGPDCRAWEEAGETQQASERFLGYQSDSQTRSGMASVGLEALIPPEQQHGANISMGQPLVLLSWTMLCSLWRPRLAQVFSVEVLPHV